jgi:hypothetical protein
VKGVYGPESAADQSAEQQEAHVAKGQIRSNKEVRKPKKTVAKAPAAAASAKTAAKGGKR